jgi:enoyl ACP reductase
MPRCRVITQSASSDASFPSNGTAGGASCASIRSKISPRDLDCRIVLLQDRRLLITGVLTPQSIAFEVARVAQEQGAEILLTSFGRAMGLTEKTARRLPDPPDVLEMDANDPSHVERLAGEMASRWGRLDGFLHAIAFAPADALGGAFLETPWESARTAFQTSAYSLKAIASGLLPLMREKGGSIVSLDFDASVAWPLYDWMGVSKAALESITRYLARDLGRHGIRVNCVSAGPLRTMAARGIPGFDMLASAWGKRAPLAWDVKDPEPVARTVAFLLSDWGRGITGEIVHVDGGFHAMGADLVEGPSDPDG